MRLRPIAVFLISTLLAMMACSFPTLEEEAPRPTPSDLDTLVPIPTEEMAATMEAEVASEGNIKITVFFTDEDNYAQAIEPYEKPVIRKVEGRADLPEAVLEAFFQGPTLEEQAQGLVLVNSGFTGFSELAVDQGVVHVYLTGECESTGATYTIAQPLRANLLQFEHIEAVKIYDETGHTENPGGSESSIPFCLEP
jgi:hypothetical protein